MTEAGRVSRPTRGLGAPGPNRTIPRPHSTVDVNLLASNAALVLQQAESTDAGDVDNDRVSVNTSRGCRPLPIQTKGFRRLPRRPPPPIVSLERHPASVHDLELDLNRFTGAKRRTGCAAAVRRSRASNARH